MNFFESFPECSGYQALFRNKKKWIGHHSRLRDVMGQSYAICIYACTGANHVRYSSVYITFCGSSKHSSLK